MSSYNGRLSPKGRARSIIEEFYGDPKEWEILWAFLKGINSGLIDADAVVIAMRLDELKNKLLSGLKVIGG